MNQNSYVSSIANIRESNAELLRIICIVSILLHHFSLYGLYPEIFSPEIKLYGWDSHMLLLLHAFFYIGVNCFIFISGWYGIKPKWKSFLNLYLIYGFYNFLPILKSILVVYWHGGGLQLPCSISYLLERTFMPFTHGYLWFMDCYLALFLIAPLLNVAIQYMDKKTYLYVLGLLTILHVYFAYYGNMNLINAEGYSVTQFVYLYLIGAFLHRHLDGAFIDKHRQQWLMGYIVCGILWGGMAVLSVYNQSISTTVFHWNSLAYNNPLILLTAIFFFLFMMSWHFRSKLVNWLATSTLAVYMMNEGVIKYSFLEPYAHRYSPLIQLGLFMGVTVAFYVFAIIVDKMRVLVQRPIWWCYDKWIRK